MQLSSAEAARQTLERLRAARAALGPMNTQVGTAELAGMFASANKNVDMEEHVPALVDGLGASELLGHCSADRDGGYRRHQGAAGAHAAAPEPSSTR